jgi:translation initiation factor 1
VNHDWTIDMAKAPRTILFLAKEESRARNVADAFLASCQSLGLLWIAQAKGFVGSLDAQFLNGVTLLVAVDLPELTQPNDPIKLERISTSPDLDRAVSGLIARLLGGSDSPVPDKPPPPQPPKKIHTVKVSRETAGRKGKGVTVVSDLPLNEDELKALTTLLKNKCGTGGTSKDGRIEIQGDHRDKLVVVLEKLGYKVKRAGG